MNRLANILRDVFHPYSHEEPLPNPSEEVPEFVLLGQDTRHKQDRPSTQSVRPTQQEVLNYLGDLAKQYHLPPKLVYAVADAESGYRTDLKVNNYVRDKRGNELKDKRGKPVVRSIDYGLMQINSSNIHANPIKDANGPSVTTLSQTGGPTPAPV
jgi:hypothetical protein